MFLRNYDNAMLAFNALNVLNSSLYSISMGSNTVTFEDGVCNQKATSGSIFPVYIISSTGSNYSKYYHNLMCFDIVGICLGDGTSAVSYDDFVMSGNVVENKLVEITRTLFFDEATSKWKLTLVATYNNSSDTNITIAEWGLWRSNSSNSSVASSYSNSSSYCVLIFREVLDEPIVIEAGTTATLTFSIDIPMPNHPLTTYEK